MSVYTPLSIGRLCPLELHMEIQEKHLMLVSYVKDFFPQLYDFNQGHQEKRKREDQIKS